MYYRYGVPDVLKSRARYGRHTCRMFYIISRPPLKKQIKWMKHIYACMMWIEFVSIPQYLDVVCTHIYIQLQIVQIHNVRWKPQGDTKTAGNLLVYVSRQRRNHESLSVPYVAPVMNIPVQFKQYFTQLIQQYTCAIQLNVDMGFGNKLIKAYVNPCPCLGQQYLTKQRNSQITVGPQLLSGYDAAV